VKEDEKALSGLVAGGASGPETGPLAEGVNAACIAAANGLIDAKVDLDDARGAVFTDAGADGCYFTGKDDAGGVGHLVKGIFDGLRDGLRSLGLSFGLASGRARAGQ